jgi:hypothetical protein
MSDRQRVPVIVPQVDDPPLLFFLKGGMLAPGGQLDDSVDEVVGECGLPRRVRGV